MYGSRVDVEALLERVEPEDLDARGRRRSSVERAPKLFGMRHRLRFKQLRAGQPPEPALGERRLARVEVADDRLRRTASPTRHAYAAKPSSRTGRRSSVYGSRTCWRPTFRAELKNASPIPTDTSSRLRCSRSASATRPW